MTKSNEWNGAQSFGRHLHSLDGGVPNPYLRVMYVSLGCSQPSLTPHLPTTRDAIGQALLPMDDDGMWPVYGFGTTATRAHSLQALSDPDKEYHGYKTVVEAYTAVMSRLKLSGPTSFAPIIRKAAYEAATRHEYFILLIITDGVIDTISERTDTINAIVEARCVTTYLATV